MDWKEWKGKKRSKATMSNHDDIYRRIYPHFMKKKHDTCWWFLKRPNALRHQWYHLFGWMIWKRKNISTQFGYHIHLLVSCCRWAENLNENENLFGYHEALLHLTVQLRRLISVLIATRSIIIIKRVDKIYIKSRSVSVSSWKLIHFVVAGKFTPGVRGPGLLFSSSAFSSWSASVQALPKTENQTKNQIMDKSLHFVFSTIRQFVGRISAWLLICWWFAAPIESQSCKVLLFYLTVKGTKGIKGISCSSQAVDCFQTVNWTPLLHCISRCFNHRLLRFRSFPQLRYTLWLHEGQLHIQFVIYLGWMINVKLLVIEF